MISIIPLSQQQLIFINRLILLRFVTFSHMETMSPLSITFFLRFRFNCLPPKQENFIFLFFYFSKSNYHNDQR